MAQESSLASLLQKQLLGAEDAPKDDLKTIVKEELSMKPGSSAMQKEDELMSDLTSSGALAEISPSQPAKAQSKQAHKGFQFASPMYRAIVGRKLAASRSSDENEFSS